MSDLVLRDVVVEGRLVDVRTGGGVVTEIERRLATRPGDDEIDGGRGALIPGLHDHHVHLLALAAAERSPQVGPAYVTDEAQVVALFERTIGRLRALESAALVAGALCGGLLAEAVDEEGQPGDGVGIRRLPQAPESSLERLVGRRGQATASTCLQVGFDPLPLRVVELAVEELADKVSDDGDEYHHGRFSEAEARSLPTSLKYGALPPPFSNTTQTISPPPPAPSTPVKSAHLAKHSLEARAGNLASEQKDLEAAFARIKDPHRRIQVGLQLVRVYRLRGHLHRAARLIAELRQQSPQSPDLLYAAYRVDSELVARSMAALSIAAPNSAQTHAVIAREDAMQNDNQGAIAEYRKALALDPKMPDAHYELAELLSFSSDSKQQAEAASFFHAALKANPRDEFSLVAIGNMALMQGNFKQAKGYFQRALKVNPNDAEANLGLAKAFMDMSQFPQAKPYLMKAIQLDPASASAHFRLATLYRIAGRRQDSRKQLVIFSHLRQIKMQHMSLYTKMRQQPMQPEGGMGSR